MSRPNYRVGLAQHQLARHTHDVELLVAGQEDGWRAVFMSELSPASEAFAVAMAAYVRGEGDFSTFCEALAAYRMAMAAAIDVAGRPV